MSLRHCFPVLLRSIFLPVARRLMWPALAIPASRLAGELILHFYLRYHASKENILTVDRQAQTSTMEIQLATEDTAADKMGNTILGVDAG